MLIIITTHPIQYQVPLWQALARDGRIPFQVWYLTHHSSVKSHDREFKQSFTWDLDLLSGYPHRRISAPANANPSSFLKCRVTDNLSELLRQCGAKAVWVQGWQVLAYWQAVWAAKSVGCKVWLRGESNHLAPKSPWKQPFKNLLLGQLFSRIDSFLCIGSANRGLYQSYGIPESRLFPAPYAVDNVRFAKQARELQTNRTHLRRAYGIPDDAFCVMFCGKFITKKHPMDLVRAAEFLKKVSPLLKLHLLFVGSGELGTQLREACSIAFDAEGGEFCRVPFPSTPIQPPASFAGFLNQTQISKAYVAADCLALPSDYGETWGLVVNEALASGLPCIISDRCGSAPDLGILPGNRVVPFGNPESLGRAIHSIAESPVVPSAPPGFEDTIESAVRIYTSTCKS